ncbi:phenylacetate--CoA ligase [soil metagenome]
MTVPTPDTQARLKTLLQSVRASNPFYRAKLSDVGDRLTELPFTTKAELAADQQSHPPYGTNLTEPREHYCRIHQTSGTSTGQPLRWLDTPQSWDNLLYCWQISFPIMGLTRQDRIFFPFSFGPFLGFWTAFEAATRAGFFCVPGGGMTSTARLRFLLEHECTIVFATPTYALHLAELAAKEGIDLAASPVRGVVVAGEPGGSIAATRQRIEQVWGARVFDHYGMTEIGPVAVEAVDTPRCLTLLTSEYIVEVLEPETNHEAKVGEAGELVLTTLGRTASPLIRYRTGDLVRLNTAGQLDGGILGRADDMLHVRGNNLYPAALEAIIRRYREVAEYRIVVDHTGPLPDLEIELETASATVADDVARAIRDELLFRVAVSTVSAGTLPRFEMKAKRVVHRGKADS